MKLQAPSGDNLSPWSPGCHPISIRTRGNASHPQRTWKNVILERRQETGGKEDGVGRHLGARETQQPRQEAGMGKVA